MSCSHGASDPLPMWFRSLNNRLLIGFLTGAVISLTLSGVLVYARVNEQFYAELGHSLTDKMRFIRAGCVQDHGTVSVGFSQEMLARLNPPRDPEFVQLTREDGSILLQSKNLEGNILTGPASESDDPILSRVTLPDGSTGLLAGHYFHPTKLTDDDVPRRLLLYAAHRTDRLEQGSREVVTTLLISSGAALAFLAVVIWGILRHNLRSLHELSGQIRTTRPSTKGTTFHLPKAPTELTPVVERLNELMAHVETTLFNEREFTANAAHEMRTPLAGIRNRIELALARPRSNEEYEEALLELLVIEGGLERLVQSLLILARLEAGTQRIDFTPLPVTDLIRRSWKPCFERAEEQDLEVDLICDPIFEPPRPLPCELLEIMCRNLFDNALSYTKNGGRIRITVRETQPDLTILVENEPVTAESQIPLDKVFLPFTRGTTARTPSERHAGIGLALCHRITESLGGVIIATRPREELFSLFVRIPIAYEVDLE